MNPPQGANSPTPTPRTDALILWCHNDVRYKAPEQILETVISHNEQLSAIARQLEREHAQLVARVASLEGALRMAGADITDYINSTGSKSLRQMRKDISRALLSPVPQEGQKIP